MARQDIERQNALQPERIKYAKDKIENLGYKILIETETELIFEFNKRKVHFFPYSGWASGASIEDGRGLKKLLNQIK